MGCVLAHQNATCYWAEFWRTGAWQLIGEGVIIRGEQGLTGLNGILIVSNHITFHELL